MNAKLNLGMNGDIRESIMSPNEYLKYFPSVYFLNYFKLVLISHSIIGSLESTPQMPW
jgi:hypothetical protein